MIVYLLHVIVAILGILILALIYREAGIVYAVGFTAAMLATGAFQKAQRMAADPWMHTEMGVLFRPFGFLSPLALLAFLIVGFVYFAWWVPMSAFVGAAVLTGVIYVSFPSAIAMYVSIGFPVSVIAIVLVIVQSRGG